MTTCRITMWGQSRDGTGRTSQHVCGEPAVRDELCARHLEDRARLGGGV